MTIFMRGAKLRPAYTVLCYVLSMLLMYAVLLGAIGTETALLSLGIGKAYNELLLSLRKLKKEAPEHKNRVFYFADSTVAMLDDDVAPPAALQRNLEEEYGINSVQVVDWAFGGASMFHYYCLTCKAHEFSPSLIIFNINYRSYSKEWFESLRERAGEAHSRELAVFAPLREDFSNGITSPLELENITLQDRVTLKFEFWETVYIGGLKIWLREHAGRILFSEASTEERWRQFTTNRKMRGEEFFDRVDEVKVTPEMIRESYPMNISRDNPEFIRLRALVDALNRRGIPFIAYLTPMNIQRLRDRDAFDEQAFRDTVNYMEEMVTSSGGIFLDLSSLLEPDDFQDKIEHYNAEGGRKVAASLSPVVKDILLPIESRNL
jgi:hypothetical protein